MIPISLADTLIIDFHNEIGELTIKSSNRTIPLNENNILYKVYNKFYQESKLPKERVTVEIEKIIPMEAGLGGGSSNGAFFIKELNSHHNNFFSTEKLIEITKEIGADIPFFIINKSCRIGGIGEQIDVFQNNSKEKVIIIKPNFGVSTPEAYREYDRQIKTKKLKSADIIKIIEGLSENRLYTISNKIENQLEESLLYCNEDLHNFREKLNSIPNVSFYMSGSGSAYYTFSHEENAESLVKELKKELNNCMIFLCNFL
jgi:4-diphosphocytidyl-2-C-methyl-D-erythritol kinase